MVQLDPAVSRPWLASYPEGVPPSFEYPKENLASLVAKAAARFPDSVAITFMDARITYGKLLDLIQRFAGVLRGLGLKKGDRVGVILPNIPQAVLAYHGTLWAGGVVVMCNPLYTERELAHQLADAEARIVLTLDLFYPKVRNIREEVGAEHVIVTRVHEFLPPLKRLLAPLVLKRKGQWQEVPAGERVLWLSQLLARETSRPPMAEANAMEDLACLQYTGGTTGLSKGVMLTHYNLLANAWQARLWLPNPREGEETVLAVLPLFHSFGQTVCMNTGFLLGANVVLVPRFDVHEVLELIQKERPSLFPGVPTMYVALINHPDVGKYNLSSIRACISGAAPLPLEVQQGFERITGGKLVEGYGLSEASPVTHANPIEGKRKIGTIGIPVPDTLARIVDPSDPRKVLPPGEPGELAVKGPQVMKGYWNRPEETAQTLVDGWLLTGDIATMDEEGYFQIVDRKKDIIIAGGFNIYPREVEEVLYQHPKVKEAVVVGIPDPYRGETVKAYIVPKEGETPTAEEIEAFCRERLAAYKVPKLWEFRKDLPKTMVGKILRRALREQEMAKGKGQAG